MSESESTLHLVCGKIAAGKSTLSKSLSERLGTVLIAEDVWLASLFPHEILNVDDYVRCSARLRHTIGPHVVELLHNGMSVVLDFPANTRDVRAWMRDMIAASGATHVLHFIDVPDSVCRARLQERNAAGTHEFTVSDEQFELITRHFEAPGPDEGFLVRVYDGEA